MSLEIFNGEVKLSQLGKNILNLKNFKCYKKSLYFAFFAVTLVSAGFAFIRVFCSYERFLPFK